MQRQSLFTLLLSLFLLGSSGHIAAAEKVEYTIESSQSLLIPQFFTACDVNNSFIPDKQASKLDSKQAPAIQWPDFKCRYRFSLFHYQQTVNKQFNQNRYLWLSIAAITLFTQHHKVSYNNDSSKPSLFL